MIRARMAVVLLVLALPGCLVVTCGSTGTLDRERAEPARGAEARPELDTGSGAGSTW